jgi:hypothetical protein
MKRSRPHGWDVYRARSAGARAAFVVRPGQSPLPVELRPAIIGTDLLDVAR